VPPRIVVVLADGTPVGEYLGRLTRRRLGPVGEVDGLARLRTVLVARCRPRGSLRLERAGAGGTREAGGRLDVAGARLPPGAGSVVALRSVLESGLGLLGPEDPHTLARRAAGTPGLLDGLVVEALVEWLVVTSVVHHTSPLSSRRRHRSG